MVSASSAIRQAFSRIRANVLAIDTIVGTAISGSSRTPVSRPGQQQGDRIVEQVNADVGAEAGDVAAAVVDAEPEPAGQRGQRRLGLNRVVQLVHPVAHVAAAANPTGQRRRDDVADPLVGGRRQQPGVRDGLGDGVGGGEPAHLDVAPRGQLERGRSQPGRGVRQRFELVGRDHPARQPNPDQRAVGRLVHGQRTRAGVLVTGAGHRLYRTAAPAWNHRGMG